MEMNHQKRLEELINSQRVFVFMKGTGEDPACRFSAHVVHLLKANKATFGYLNVLEDEEMRQAIKDFTGWPTIPQVFVEGKFIGGADILQEMEDSGELKAVLG
jgi:monothiol glutaredoxin